MALLWDLQMALLRRDYNRAINRLLEYYREHGESFQVTVNSSKKTIELRIVLKDSPDSRDIRVADYSLTHDSGQLHLSLRGIETPWQWLDFVLRLFKGKEVRIPIPPNYAPFVEALL